MAPPRVQDGQKALLARKVLRQQQTIRQREEEITRLRAALQAFVTPGEQYPDYQEDDEDVDMYEGGDDEDNEVIELNEDDDDDNEVIDLSDEGVEGNPYRTERVDTGSMLDIEALRDDVVWDKLDCVYRCAECTHEVVGGECQNCGLLYRCKPNYPPDNHQSVSTDNQILNPDRFLVGRGSTPLRYCDSAESLADDCPTSFEGNDEEYIALIQRGASRAMIEEFNLRFSPGVGIIAWATPDIYAAFAGDAMQDSDFWKIHLGRRIVLDDGDDDGSRFVEDLLEEVLFYPLQTEYVKRGLGGWVTVEETPGIWLTEPRPGPKELALPEVDSDGDSIPDEYVYDREAEWFQQRRIYNDKQLLVDVTEQIQYARTGVAIRADEYEATDDDEDESDSDRPSSPSLDQCFPGHGFDSKYRASDGSSDSEDEDQDEDQDDEDEDQELEGEEVVDIPEDDAGPFTDLTSSTVPQGKRKQGDVDDVGGGDAVPTVRGTKRARSSPRIAEVDSEEISEADSDFDSDEVLSGDEEALVIAQSLFRTRVAPPPVQSSNGPASFPAIPRPAPAPPRAAAIGPPVPPASGPRAAAPMQQAQHSGFTNGSRPFIVFASEEQPQASSSTARPPPAAIRRTKQTARKTDPNAPKGAKNAYAYFTQSQWHIIRGNNLNIEPKHIGSLVGAAWAQLSAGEKEPFDELARIDRARYNREQREYRDRKQGPS